MGLLPITFARVLYAVLAGVLTFVLFWAVGALIVDNSMKNADIGQKLKDFAPLVGLLVGLLTYFVNPAPKTPVA